MAGEKIDLNNMKKEIQLRHIYIMAKVKVKVEPDFKGDCEMFRLYWRREVQEALKDIGEVKFFALAT